MKSNESIISNSALMSDSQKVKVSFLLVGSHSLSAGDQRRDQRLVERLVHGRSNLLVDGRCANTPRPVRSPDLTRSRT